mmetsp:Transcript_106435/g.286357  ORF Transcript_106435/g.286357 Transcript_106435/m.286357 type:complete len:200 (+) Transcript_106435:347-946(+)
MGAAEGGRGLVHGRLIGCLRVPRADTMLRARLEFCAVAEVVALHLHVKDLALARGGRADEVLVQDIEDALAEVVQLLLHRSFVVLDRGLRVRGLLLRAEGDRSPGLATRGRGILVSHRERVPLVERELRAHASHALHVLHHVVVPLRLLGQPGHEDALLARARHRSLPAPGVGGLPRPSTGRSRARTRGRAGRRGAEKA